MLSKVIRNYLAHIRYDFVYATTPLNSLEIYCVNPNGRDKFIISEHASSYAVNEVYQKVRRFVYQKARVISVFNKMDCDVYNSWRGEIWVVYIPHLFTFLAIEQNCLDSKIALNVGRYTADKRQADLIEIWLRVRNKNG